MNVTTESLLDISLGLPADVSILSVSVGLFVIELFLILAVIIGQQSYLQFCCYKIKSGSGTVGKEGLWLHLLFHFLFVFALYKIACQISHLIQKAKKNVSEEDLFTIVVSLTLFDVTFAILLKILLRVARTTTFETKTVKVVYYTLCTILGLAVAISVIACIYQIIVFAVIPLSGQRLFTSAVFVPLTVIVKVTFAVILVLTGLRIIYAIRNSCQVSEESKLVSIKIFFSMVCVILSMLIMLAGVCMAFATNGAVVMVGLLVASILPEAILFLVITILFWPKRFTITSKVPEKPETQVDLQTPEKVPEVQTPQ
jgi:hypothetical protein